MILEQETFEKFRHWPKDLLPKSNKYVVIKCDYCNIIIDRKLNYLNRDNIYTSKHICGSKDCNSLKKREVAMRRYAGKHPSIGQKFGRWTIISEIKQNLTRPRETGIGWYYYATCKCDCGTIRDKQLNELRSKSHFGQSCGCLRIETARKRMTTHGKSKTKLNHVWISMRDRCNNPNQKAYRFYGAKGVKVCEEWNDFVTFETWAINNNYKEGLHIHRIDSNKNYCPKNCLWITGKENSRLSVIDTKLKRQQIMDENKQLKQRIAELENQLLVHK